MVKHAATIAERATRLAGQAPALVMRARLLAQDVLNGQHGLRKPGQGSDFWQYREYRPGDSVRGIDWKKTAKSAHTYIREQEWQSSPRFWLWVDTSPSLRASAARHETSILLALALMILFEQSGEPVGAWMPERRMVRGEQGVLDYAGWLLEPHTHSDFPAPEPLPSGSQVVVISDGFHALSSLSAWLGIYPAQRVPGQYIVVQDAEEASFPYTGITRFRHPETGEIVELGAPESVRERYQERWNRHFLGLAETVERNHWGYHAVSTADSLLEFLRRLAVSYMR